MESIQGKCPNGCGDTLFLGDGGYVTCSYIECPDPEAASILLDRKPIQSVEEALREFHSAFNLLISNKPVVPEGDNELDWDAISETFNLREKLIREEFIEVMEAHEDGILVNIAKELCDLVYVVVGTAVSYGIPFDKCFAEVQRSNMSKLGEDGKPIYNEYGKVLKGPNYSSANLREIIYAQYES